MVTGPSGIAVPAEGEGPLPDGPADSTIDPEVDETWLAWLPAVLDTLLPANEHLAAAGHLGLATAVLADATWSPEFPEALRWLGDELPTGFAAADEPARVEALRTLEQAQPRRFAAIV